MMEMMRKSAPAVIIIAVVAFVGTTFITGGGVAKVIPVGTVGDEVVSLTELGSQIDRTYDNINAQDIDITDEQRRDIPMSVWEDIVAQRVMARVAEEMDLSATAKEVLISLKNNPPAQLRQNPYFANEETGQFDLARYQEIMSDPSTYDIPMIRYLEDNAYTQLPSRKIATLLQIGNVVSPSEVEAQYHHQNDVVAFEYLVARPFDMDLEESALNDDAIAVYYNSNLDKYESDEQVELYYVVLPKVATSFDEQVLTDELLESKSEILAGNSTFEDEADRESDDEGTRANGGKIGWIGRGDMPSFDHLFDVAVGEYAETFKTDMGIHLALVDSASGEGDSAKVFIRHIVKTIQPTPVSLDSIDALSDDIVDIADTSNLFTAIEALGLTLDSTGLFGKADIVPGIGYQSGLGQFAFSGDMSLAELFSDEGAVYVVAIKERVAAGTLPLDRVSTGIKRVLRDSLQIEAAKEYLTSITSDITGSFSEFAETDSMVAAVNIDSAVARSAFISGVGSETRIVAAAFGTDLNTISEPVFDEGARAVFLVRPTERIIMDTVPDAEYESLERLIQARRAQTQFREWFIAMREELGVEEEVRKYFY